MQLIIITIFTNLGSGFAFSFTESLSPSAAALRFLFSRAMYLSLLRQKASAMAWTSVLLLLPTNSDNNNKGIAREGGGDRK